MGIKTQPASLPTEHSPFGGSSAYRFIACPGSVNMSAGIEDEESEHAALGTAAHALAAFCLKNGNTNAWEYIGQWAVPGGGFVEANGAIPDNYIEVDANMADAVQVYLDAVQERHTVRHGQIRIEFPFHAKEIHPQMYGRSDLVFYDKKNRHLHVWDYKHGVGVVVGVKYNSQTLYYATGVLEQLGLWHGVDCITTYIVQPRGFHPDGPVRSFTYSLKDIVQWLSNTLLPAMALAEVSRETIVGDHCRFCPARTHGCPAQMENSKELDRMNKRIEKDGAAPLTPEEIGEVLTVFSVAKIQEKGVRSVALARLNKDKPIPGWKLVSGRVARTWKEGVFGPAYKEFASQAFKDGIDDMASRLLKVLNASTNPKEAAFTVSVLLDANTIKSPAQFDKLPGGKEFSARWAAKLPAPRTLAPIEDVRRGLSTNVKTLFKPVKKD